MRTALRIVKIAVKALICLLAGILLVYNVYMLIARYALKQDMPTVFGCAFAVVASGSMEPYLSVNDMIVTRAQEGYAVGDVIMFYDAARGEYVTHRIIIASDGVYTTQGDANSSPDRTVVSDGAVVGKVVAVLAGAGTAVRFLQSPAGFFCVLGGGVVLWLVMDLLSGLGKKNERDDRNEDEGQQT